MPRSKKSDKAEPQEETIVKADDPRCSKCEEKLCNDCRTNPED